MKLGFSVTIESESENELVQWRISYMDTVDGVFQEVAALSSAETTIEEARAAVYGSLKRTMKAWKKGKADS